LGKGVLKAVENVGTVIAPELIGYDVREQVQIDRRLCELDGTLNKEKLGANAILGVSLACAKAAAQACELPLFRYVGGAQSCVLPVPMMNILNGGAHADNNVDVQEFMVAPVGAPTFREGLRVGAEVYHSLKKTLKEKGYLTSIGDEGGFAPNLNSNEEALDLILSATEGAGYSPGEDVFICLDAAASSFYRGDHYYLEAEAEPRKDASAMVAYWQRLVDNYPIFSIEDGLDENDWDAWKDMTATLGERLQIVGDDLFVTNTERLRSGIAMGVGRPPKWHTKPATLQSSRTGPARLKTPPSQTSRWQPMPGRSRPVRRVAPIGWPSTISCCASKTPWATPRSITVPTSWRDARAEQTASQTTTRPARRGALSFPNGPKTQENDTMAREQTLAIIKPDATARNIAGMIISRIEEEDFTIQALKKLRLSKADAECFYAVHRDRPFYGSLTDFMSSGTVVVMCLEREDAIGKWRATMGATNPSEAAPGTIRKLYGIDVEKNSVHGSDAPETAATEIGFFFSGLELV
jgi:nucleoside diphosphate kinase